MPDEAFKKQSAWWRVVTNSARTSEDMFVAPDARSVHRGNRRASRTEVFRPCLLWTIDRVDTRVEGIILDLNRFGFKVRTLADFKVGSELWIQMMRDDDFQFPLSGPIRCTVMRKALVNDGFLDCGLQVVVLPLGARGKRPEIGRSPLRPASPTVSRMAPRMHTLDYTIGNREKR